jgi:hypothetical protein
VTTAVNRFLKTFALLIVSLFVLVTGVDAALDHLNQASMQNSFTIYNEQGHVILAYDGDLNACKAYAKPSSVAPPSFFHRT